MGTSYAITAIHSKKAQAKFLRYVLKIESGCWLWQAGKSSTGYGRVYLDVRGESSHRIAYALFKSDVPKGLWVLHTCDVPSCVNPDHLYLGTPKDNILDAMNRGRWRGGTYLHLHPERSVLNGNKVPRPKGEKHGMAKLRDQQVRDVRDLCATGIPMYKVAKQFNVTQSAIWRIVHHLAWRHIE